MLAHYIEFETIKNDALKATGRLKTNWHQGILDEASPNIFAHSELEHPLESTELSVQWTQVLWTINWAFS